MSSVTLLDHLGVVDWNPQSRHTCWSRINCQPVVSSAIFKYALSYFLRVSSLLFNRTWGGGCNYFKGELTRQRMHLRWYRLQPTINNTWALLSLLATSLLHRRTSSSSQSYPPGVWPCGANATCRHNRKLLVRSCANPINAQLISVSNLVIYTIFVATLFLDNLHEIFVDWLHEQWTVTGLLSAPMLSAETIGVQRFLNPPFEESGGTLVHSTRHSPHIMD